MKKRAFSMHQRTLTEEHDMPTLSADEQNKSHRERLIYLLGHQNPTVA
jgi:hypothetical protein